MGREWVLKEAMFVEVAGGERLGAQGLGIIICR